MNLFSGNKGIALAIVLVMLAAAAAAWRMQTRSDNRAAQETKSRIERDVKSSIENATKGIKLCPLSDPDCNKR
jgi:type II secretory pathway pseudopilin PulG